MLKAENLAIARGGSELFSGLSFTAQPGSVTVVLGPNGAGKSSLLLALAGLLPCDGGSVALGDADLSCLSRREIAKRIAWQGSLPPTEFGLSVAQRLELACGAALDHADDAERLARAAGLFELKALLSRPLAALSSGERQRVELASLFVRDLPLWLMDEPAAHLDLKHQAALLKLMRAEADAGRTIVTVLHDLQQASSIADEVVLIGEGQAECGSAQTMFDAARLGELFGTHLQSLGGSDRPLLLPDYMGGEL